ncbi:MAG: HAMP domain-containing histidine kinase, partial [Spirochaetales bacterium]|nr:HAMP domain-containing histidine kinase [Spirochaetales bacterium]
VMAESVEFYNTRAQDKGIVMKIICATRESIIYGRREGLESIITNLLSNAIKYTNRGGEITLKMTAEGEQVFIEVSDTGIGIPKEEQKKLFNEFFRASNARQFTEDGTGIGLAIVKANVDRHGGKIEFKSEEGKGTTFKVTLKRLGN